MTTNSPFQFCMCLYGYYFLSDFLAVLSSLFLSLFPFLCFPFPFFFPFLLSVLIFSSRLLFHFLSFPFLLPVLCFFPLLSFVSFLSCSFIFPAGSWFFKLPQPPYHPQGGRIGIYIHICIQQSYGLIGVGDVLACFGLPRGRGAART